MRKCNPVLHDLAGEVRNRVVKNEIGNNPQGIATVARELIPRISDVELVELVAQLSHEHVGLGPLSQIVQIPQVTDVIVNGHSDIWIDRGQGLERINSPWQSEADLRLFATQLAVANFRRLDELNPYVDIQTRSGLRCHIVTPPLSCSGTQISLRIPNRSRPSLDVLLEGQAVELLTFLQAILTAKQSVMICGGTGSGKTTLLAALLREVSSTERIVVIEDSLELSIDHPHVVNLQSRLPNSEGVGEVAMRTLVRQALRMRPDRIVIGEIRGAEIIELFAALNTGHLGSATTIHANSAPDVITRVQLLGAMYGLNDEAVHQQLASTIDIVIGLTNDKGKRIISEIGGLHLVNDRCQYFPFIVTQPWFVITDYGQQFLKSLEPLTCE